MRRVVAGLLGAGASSAAAELLRSRFEGPRWQRRNYRNRQVSLLGGIGAALGVGMSAAATGGRPGAAAFIAAGSAGLIGALDDQDTTGTSKGFRGHLRALARGEVTTGTAKLVGIAAAGQCAAAIGTQFGARGRPGRSAATRGIDVLTSGMLIAGTANLVNLFDLRPGRGLKVTAAVSAPLAVGHAPGAPLAAGALGVIAGSWRADLAEEAMLGDAGANSLGALAGTALALHPSRNLRGGALGVVLVLTAISEKVSFSQVIERTGPLRALDIWGRRE
ncbi:MAG TPA: hypothetical protein VK095_05235 [Beutenbergiaceae bacterium]|nr:hypothetical protein [Beutenbergiaceae bacterium]